MNFIVTLLILIFILGIIIFIHEFGHFIAAKKSGVYVDEFALGMGPKIWESKRKHGETKYSLRLFPVGGFVAMANEENPAMKVRKDQVLENKGFVKRFLVLIMGILFNFILTIILLFINGLIFGSPETKPVLGQIVDNSPAYTYGLMEGDTILEVNGIKTKTWDDVLLEISIKESVNSYDFLLNRNGNIIKRTVVPNKIMDKDTEKNSFGFAIGQSKTYGFVSALKYSITGFVGMFRSIFLVLGNLFTRNVSVNNLSGPVGIFTVVDQIKSSGLENIIYLIAYLSVNVGIINLVPIPVFDGGRIVLLIIETISKKKYPKLERILNTVGFFLLIALMVYVTFNDILKLF